jgi:hypothetical protein
LLFLFQPVDQADGVEEAHPLARVDGGPASGRRQMAFPRARPADQDQIARLRHEGRRGELLDVGLLEGRLGPVEAGDVAVDGEAGRADLTAKLRAWRSACSASMSLSSRASGLAGRDGTAA